MVCSMYFTLSVGMVDEDVEELQDFSNQVHQQHHGVWFEVTIGHPQGAAGWVQASLKYYILHSLWSRKF